MFCSGRGQMAAFNSFLGKFSGEQRKDLGELYGVVWEADAEVGQCRECGTQFTVVVRRHHCRGCGGIYCENCLANTITINEASERGCGGCFIGATPGETIKELAKTLSSTQESSATQAIPFRLSHGKLFGDGKVSGGPSTAPTAGYFELINKGTSVICAKLYTKGSFASELSRPFFTPVLPQESVFAQFDAGCDETTLIVLTDNRSAPPADGKVVIQGDGRTKASPFCAVENFRRADVYKIPSKGHNVLLKYKPGAGIELREGSSVARLGFLGALTGAPPAGDLDFRTNVDGVETLYSS